MFGKLINVLTRIEINLLKSEPTSDWIPLKLFYSQKIRHPSSQEFNEMIWIPQFTGNYFRVGGSKK